MKKISPEEFRDELQKSPDGLKYLETVQKILAEDRGLVREYGYEFHHIHPRGLGGARRASSNMLKVTCFEHCLLHALLVKALPCFETAIPLVKMSAQYEKCPDFEKITLEELYEWSTLRHKAHESAVGRKRTEEARKRMSIAHKGRPGTTTGRIRIHKGREGKIVKPELLDSYLDDGWKIGVPERTPEHRRKLSERNKGKKVSEASKQKNREAHLGKPGGNKGRIFIHKGDLLKRIDPSELETYAADGWKKGFGENWNPPKCKHSDEWRQKVSASSVGKIYIQKDGEAKRIFPEDFPKYAEEGWVKGRPPLKRIT